MKLGKQYSGVAGEYFVAAELSRHGFLAAVTLRNSDSVDILASDESGKHQLAIQVKTTQGKDKWLLTSKVELEENSSDNKYFVFVNLPSDKNLAPTYSIIKAKELGAFIKKAHKDWLEAPGKNRKDHNARQYEPKWVKEEDGYKAFTNFIDFVASIKEK